MLFGFAFIYLVLNGVKIYHGPKAPVTHRAPVTAALTQLPPPPPFSFVCIAQEANLELHFM